MSSSFVLEEDAAKYEAAVYPYSVRIRDVLKEAFEHPDLDESAKGVLISSILVNMMNLLKINLSKDDFNITLSSMLRSIGIENWNQTRYN